MKKTRIFVISVLGILLLLCSCSNRPQAAKLALPAEQIVEVHPKSAAGLCPLQPGVEIDETTTLPEEVCVYVDPYPYDVIGRPLYQLTEEEKLGVQTRLYDFLSQNVGKSLQPSEILADDWEDMEYRVSWHDDELDCFAWPGYMRIFSSGHIDLQNAIAADDQTAILGNSLIQAALTYVGIAEPKVNELTKLESLNPNPDYHNRYRIIEMPETPAEEMYRSSFQYVDVTLYKSEKISEVMVEVCNLQPEPVPVSAYAPYDAAASCVQKQHPKELEDIVSVTAYYDRRVEFGLYVPCYQFAGQNRYQSTVAMTDFEKLAENQSPAVNDDSESTQSEGNKSDS